MHERVLGKKKKNKCLYNWMIAATLLVLRCEEELYSHEKRSSVQSWLGEIEPFWDLSISGQAKGRCEENVPCPVKRLSATFPRCFTMASCMDITSQRKSQRKPRVWEDHWVSEMPEIFSEIEKCKYLPNIGRVCDEPLSTHSLGNNYWQSTMF